MVTAVRTVSGSGDHLRSVGWASESSLQVEGSSPISLQSVVDIANRLRRFFSLLTGFPLAPPSIEVDRPPGVLRRSAGPYAFSEPEVHYLPDFPVAPDGSRVGEILLTARDAGDSTGDLLGGYLSTEGVLRPAVDALLVTLSNTDLPDEIQCLLLTQGLEVLHRVTSDETHLPKQEFRKLSRKLRKLNFSDQGIACSTETRKRLYESIGRANGLSLAERLESLLKRLPQSLVSAVMPDGFTFVRAAVETRNHLTHRSEPKQFVCAGGELIVLNLRMKILLLSLLLERLGVDAGLLAKRVPQSALFVELVQADLAP